MAASIVLFILLLNLFVTPGAAHILNSQPEQNELWDLAHNIKNYVASEFYNTPRLSNRQLKHSILTLLKKHMINDGQWRQLGIEVNLVTDKDTEHEFQKSGLIIGRQQGEEQEEDLANQHPGEVIVDSNDWMEPMRDTMRKSGGGVNSKDVRHSSHAPIKMLNDSSLSVKDMASYRNEWLHEVGSWIGFTLGISVTLISFIVAVLVRKIVQKRSQRKNELAELSIDNPNKDIFVRLSKVNQQPPGPQYVISVMDDSKFSIEDELSDDEEEIFNMSDITPCSSPSKVKRPPPPYSLNKTSTPIKSTPKDNQEQGTT